VNFVSDGEVQLHLDTEVTVRDLRDLPGSQIRRLECTCIFHAGASSTKDVSTHRPTAVEFVS
jgi:hypothetical protein